VLVDPAVRGSPATGEARLPNYVGFHYEIR
jgi:hypothetical protein